MKIFDLSHEINNEINVYPGDPEVKLEKIATIEKDGYVMHRLELNSHLSTHIDAPGHILKNAKMIDQFPPEYFTGAAFIIKARCTNKNIIEVNLPDNKNFEHLIINCGWYKKWGSKAYYFDYPVLSEKLANKIAGLPIKTVAFDTPSVDSVHSQDYSIHKIFLKKDILILENLTSLDKLNGRYVELFAFPLKLKSVDGSPVRVIAIEK
jgi:kynurenine formamidase